MRRTPMSRALRKSLPAGVALLVAIALRVHGLGAQLWVDEIDALTDSIRRPVVAIATGWPPGAFGIAASPHVLHDLLAHASVVSLGESPASVRLPSALFGVLGVGALYVLTASRLGSAPAAASSLLLAVSYPHVFQSQNARGYTALLFFATLASDRLLRAPLRARGQAAYAASAALAAYSVPLGAFVAAGHAAALAADGIVAFARRRAPRLDLRAVAAAITCAGALTALLYAPLLGALLRFTGGQSRLPTAAGSQGGPLYRLGVLRAAIVGLTEAFGGSLGLFAATVVTGLGLWLWWRRDGLSLSVVSLPVLVQAAVLLALDVPLSPRYFVLALPTVIIALGLGVSVVAGALSARLAPPRAREIVEGGIVAVVIAACAWPLVGYYRVPKQDFLGAAARLEALAQPGDRWVAVQHAGRVLRGYYAMDFADVRTVAELEALEGEGHRILLVATLERFLAVQNRALLDHIHASYRRLEELPATIAGAEMVLYEREAARR